MNESNRPLERAFLFTIVCHAVAMIAMVTLLLPGMPSSGNIHTQMEYVAAHPWLWRLGWFPWQLTALSDLVFAIALLRTKWISRPIALAVLLFTIGAIAVEQPNELAWMTTGVELAQRGLIEPYVKFRDSTFALVGYWAAALYCVAAVFWSIALAKAKCWNRFLTALSIVTWGLLFSADIFPLVVPTFPALIVSTMNAIGFCLLMIWLLVAAELVLRRSRPTTEWGRQAIYKTPYSGLIGRGLDFVGNCWLLKSFGEMIGSPPLRSDIVDVLYINYLLEWRDLDDLVPKGTRLQHVGMMSDQSILSILIFRHGHFGPKFLGPLRKLLPSPVQSNWRIYVYDPDKPKLVDSLGVAFLANTVSNPVSSLIARIFAEGMPMHVPESSDIHCDGKGAWKVNIDRGNSSSPNLHATFQEDERRRLPGEWGTAFWTAGEAIEYLIPQNRAFSYQPWSEKLTRQSIELGINLDEVKTLQGNIRSQAIQDLVGDAEPFVFCVRNVQFDFLGQSKNHLSTKSCG